MLRPSLLGGALILLVATGLGCGTSSPTSRSGDTVTEEDVERSPQRRLQDLLVERVPGVRLSETGGGFLVVRIRGQASLLNDTPPLYVVDGQPVEPNPDGSLPGVPLSEIASIQVYKNPSDTSRWGMRGAHGVIVVTTKGARQ